MVVGNLKEKATLS